MGTCHTKSYAIVKTTTGTCEVLGKEPITNSDDSPCVHNERSCPISFEAKKHTPTGYLFVAVSSRRS